MKSIPEHYAMLVKTICEISETYFRSGKLNDNLTLLKHGRELVKHGEIHPVDDIKLLLQYGKMLNWNIFMNGGSNKTALSLLTMAQQKADEIGNEQQLGYALMYQGEAHDFQTLASGESDEDNLNESLGYFQQALEHFNSIGDEQGRSSAHFRIGMIHQRQHQIDEMESHLDEARKIAERHNLAFEKSEAIWHLAYVYAQRGNVQTSLQFAEETLKLRTDLELTIFLPLTYRPLGMIYEFLNDRETALHHYQQSLKLAEQMELKIPTMEALYALGGWYLKDEELEQAKNYLQRGYEIAIEIHHQRGISNGASQLEQIVHV
ncbi:tetratricopeptide repeat protein [Chloroflexi bacterium TSY]|nr:tetratricopeptide repeat protein [Chloroflexi bacterium TSY]